MSVKSEIEILIERNWSFKDGLNLLKKSLGVKFHPFDRHKSITKTLKAKLRAELLKQVPRKKTPKPKKVVAIPFKPIPITQKTARLEKPPIATFKDYQHFIKRDAVLDLMAASTQSLFNKREIISGKLSDPGLTKELRSEMIDEIDAINQAMDEIKLDRSHYKEHGVEREKSTEEQIEDLDLIALKKQIKLAQTNISKNESKVKNKDLTERQKIRIQSNLAKWKRIEKAAKAQKTTIENQSNS